MKTDKEFLDEIYIKYKEKTKEKKRKIQKIINMAAIIVIVLSSFILLTDFDKKELIIQNGKIEESKMKLKTVGSFENFYNVVRDGYMEKNRLSSGICDNKESVSLVNDMYEKQQYQTNTQEATVDEADIVKVIDNHIYYITDRKIEVINAESAEMSENIAEISYEQENFTPSEIYVNNQKLVVIGNEYSEDTMVDVTERASKSNITSTRIREDKSGIRIYDISNHSEPEEIRRVSIDGNCLSSRMIKDSIYLISTKNIYNSEIITNKIDDLDEKDYMIKYVDTNIDQEEKYIDYSNMYCFEEIESLNYLITVGLNINTNEEANIQTFLGTGNYIYSSEKNMYIATPKLQVDRKYRLKKSNTHILKFELDNGKFNFKVEGDVNGVINNQFSMDENEDCFRIATTTGNIWNVDKDTKNNIYILDEELKIIGQVTDFAEGERIYSVRYTDDKAYIVTFNQIDPLFVIDLTNSKNPQILGELKLPGYSTYLHPYDETHIIGFGYDVDEKIVTNGLKMTMFDVEDLKNPKKLFEINIGGKYTSSEIMHNHKALLDLKEKNIIAFPLRNYENKSIKSRADIYEIDLEKGFLLKGKISNENSAKNNYKQSIERIIYVNNSYYALSKEVIKVADMESLEIIKEIKL